MKKGDIVTVDVAENGKYEITFENASLDIETWQVIGFSVDNQAKKLSMTLIEPLFIGEPLLKKLSECKNDFTLVCTIFGAGSIPAYNKKYNGCKIEAFNEDDLVFNGKDLLKTVVVCSFENVDYEKISFNKIS